MKGICIAPTESIIWQSLSQVQKANQEEEKKGDERYTWDKSGVALGGTSQKFETPMGILKRGNNI